MDKIVSLARRRGFVFPSSEIYGGLGSTYDYGHYGVLLKEQRARALARGDGARAGGHRRARLVDHPPPARVGGVGPRRRASPTRSSTAAPASCAFAPTSSTDAQCGKRPSKRPGETPDCDLTERGSSTSCSRRASARSRRRASIVYLRPETAQGIFINFKNVAQLARRKPPFGIAQVGKSFRNEITPGNFIFRTLEFEQMEMEFFVPPDAADEWYRYWVAGAATTGTLALRRCARAICASARTTRTSSRTTRARRATSSTSSRSAGPSSRASRTAATST